MKYFTEREKWLDEILGLAEAAALRKVSIDTLRSEIRRGRHALRLPVLGC